MKGIATHEGTMTNEQEQDKEKRRWGRYLEKKKETSKRNPA